MRRFLYAVALGAAMSACASESDPVPAPTSEVGTSTPAPGGSSSPAPAAPKDDEPAPAAPKNDCKLDAMTVEDVVPAFVIYELPNEIPAPMKGGTLSGQYAV